MTITHESALERLKGDDLLDLGMDADAVRQSLWPERVVTYTITHSLPIGAAHDWLPVAEAAIERGARSFLLYTSPASTLERTLADIRDLRRRFADIPLTGLTMEAIARWAHTSSFENVTAALSSAGLEALSAHDASGTTLPADLFSRMHRAAHRAGLATTATLILRRNDAPEDWLQRLDEIARIQEDSFGFLACEPRIEKLERELDEVTAAQYLKLLALSRIYLPHVPHIQTDWSIFGPKVLQVALRFGADDAGLIEAAARDPRIPSHHSGEEELRRIIRDAGFQPSQRDALYRRHFLA